jgi:archaellum component FlaC
MKFKVEGTNFVKDTTTNALLMTGRSALIENEARRKLAQRINGKNDEINNIKSQVESMSNDMKDIKQLLNALLNQSKE